MTPCSRALPHPTMRVAQARRGETAGIFLRRNCRNLQPTFQNSHRYVPVPFRHMYEVQVFRTVNPETW